MLSSLEKQPEDRSGMSTATAGSSTQSMESLSVQTANIKTDLMKQSTVNRAFVREIMLQHERTFKEQVHDLHKLYEVQRMLMQKCSLIDSKGFTGASECAIPPCFSVKTLCQKRDSEVVEFVTPCKAEANTGGELKERELFPGSGIQELNVLYGKDKSIQNKLNHHRKPPTSSTRSSPRKRKLDLEQLPQDDTEDELEADCEAVIGVNKGEALDTLEETSLKLGCGANLGPSLTQVGLFQVQKGMQAAHQPKQEFTGHAATTAMLSSRMVPSISPSNGIQGPANLKAAADLLCQHTSLNHHAQGWQLSPYAVPQTCSIIGRGPIPTFNASLWYPPPPPPPSTNYQQQHTIFRPRAISPISHQAAWLQSPPVQSPSIAHGGVHQQQVGYGVEEPGTKAAQTGVRVEGTERVKLESTGLCLGPGSGSLPSPVYTQHHQYSFSSLPHPSSFKKPPKLVLKNNGVTKEWQLTTPDSKSGENPL